MKKTTFLLNLLVTLLAWGISTHSFAANPPSKTQMLTDWQRARSYTKEYLDAMPEVGMNFKPTPEMRSYAEQMLHIAGANFAFGSGASGKPNPYQGKELEKMNEYKTKAALTQIVLESYDFMMEGLNAATPAQLSETIKLFNMSMTRELTYNKAFEHQTHHRGQTTVYLRLKGVKPPQEKLF